MGHLVQRGGHHPVGVEASVENDERRQGFRPRHGVPLETVPEIAQEDVQPLGVGQGRRVPEAPRQERPRRRERLADAIDEIGEPVAVPVGRQEP
ncbi:MAG: hypothetical protein AUH92_05875 [Acidobacteria bacterium 13_1_40CM_4_69_4]|nr:MAG: hypothetical protein AUH92_05875 [Acidobacteria bacterium 13_1_40CM_4_69_4]